MSNPFCRHLQPAAFVQRKHTRLTYIRAAGTAIVEIDTGYSKDGMVSTMSAEWNADVPPNVLHRQFVY